MGESSQPRALVLTVGTGDMEKLEDTLLAPLRKSIVDGEWDRVLLLPSQITETHASRLRTELSGVPITVQPLPEAGQENDADACFSHFDTVIAGLRAEGLQEADIVVDFTRGTKAMSAALVLAAVRHDLPKLRYIVGDRDQRGMVTPGTERISEIKTAMATAQKMIDTALGFFKAGNFGAALEVLPHPRNPFARLWPASIRKIADTVRPWAEFYAAWDRLDYKAAAGVTIPNSTLPSSPCAPLEPTSEMRNWVIQLAQDYPTDPEGMAQRLRLLAADLLANGERRIRDRHYEDALLRAYRVLELIGQMRLFDQGLDSGALPPDHEAVKRVAADVAKKRRGGFSKAPGGKLVAGREQVARLLRAMGDPLAKKLFRAADQGMLNTSARNMSVLIHGFEAASTQGSDALETMYATLSELLFEDGGPEAERRLAFARSLDLSAEA